MSKVVLRYGIIAGLIVAAPWMWIMIRLPADADMTSLGGVVQGYIIMVLGLSMVFLGIKHYRDKALGGVIKFGRAFLVGLGISAVAGVFYVVGWEIATAVSDFDFAGAYAKSMIEAERARGAGAAELAKATTDAADFTRMYSNPLIRLPMLFAEIFPVGIAVSLISAAVLRNSRVLAANRGTA